MDVKATALEKSFDFALAILKLSRSLIANKEYVIAKQLLKSGTSIGANIEEGERAESKKDFVHKLSIALKECYETTYWLRLLKESGIRNATETDPLISDVTEIIKMLTSTINTTKRKYGLISL